MPDPPIPTRPNIQSALDSDLDIGQNLGLKSAGPGHGSTCGCRNSRGADLLSSFEAAEDFQDSLSSGSPQSVPSWPDQTSSVRPKSDLRLNPPIIKLDRVSVTLGQYLALKEVSARIPQKSQTVIIGPNGAGKSTLVQTILGFFPFQGYINYHPKKPRFGYVPQRLDFDRHMPLTVTEFLALGLTGWPLWLGVTSKMRRKIWQSLEEVKARELADKPLGALSGGESQRILLAAALMSKPEVLVLDEPATGVDINGEQLLCELLDGFKADYTIIMVSHDLPMAKAHSDWVICLNRRVVAQGPPDNVFTTKILNATFGLHHSLDF
ncbi:MAG: metal ABC transporter ATP-binding protein [Deltaproteobacteria bacterium]|jgi:zinc transport system ATP-binding protein|nr:metal ABC transporter ATP-binding protein [Deltaproteobacteria bacterium]